MSLILALDQGTTSSRALLFDVGGNIVSLAQREHRQFFPKPGWVEHDPNAIWRTQLETARECLAIAGIDAESVAAIGIANQRETTIMWDRTTGTPVQNAIVWQDRRTAGWCEQMRGNGLEGQIQQVTGLTLDPYFSGGKIIWLLENIPGLRLRAERGEIAFGTVESFLIWKLTGGRVHVTDTSNASRTLLFNLNAASWDQELLRVFDIPEAILPKVVASSGVIAETDSEWFGASIPIAGLAGDQQAALFGQACFTPGNLKNTYGTGAFLLANAGNQPRRSGHRLLTTAAWSLPDGDGAIQHTYALEGSVFVCGAAVQWLRDDLGLIGSSAESNALARSVQDTKGVYFVPAFTGLGAPYWEPNARGAIVGLTRGAGRAHIVRAALEAACFQTMDVVGAMRSDGVPVTDLRVDGGMSANDFVMQFQADILGVPVIRPRSTEATAWGAACLAGLGVAAWPNLNALEERRHVERVFEPEMSHDRRDELVAGWRIAVGMVAK